MGDTNSLLEAKYNLLNALGNMSKKEFNTKALDDIFEITNLSLKKTLPKQQDKLKRKKAK